jgi:hypothetical protein
MDQKDYIALEDCKHNFLYKLMSRNLKYGVFNKETNGFTGLRRKFGSVFLFEEYHWDTGAPYGTVHPLEELEDFSDLVADEDKLELVLLKLEYIKQQEEIHTLENDLWRLKANENKIC